MDPMTLQILLGAAGAVAGWWAKHFLAPAGPVSPVVPTPASPTPAGPSIDPALAAVLALLEKAIEDRLAKRGAP